MKCVQCGAGDDCVVIKTEADSDDIIESSRDEKTTTGMLNSDYTLCLLCLHCFLLLPYDTTCIAQHCLVNDYPGLSSQ